MKTCARNSHGKETTNLLFSKSGQADSVNRPLYHCKFSLTEALLHAVLIAKDSQNSFIR